MLTPHYLLLTPHYLLLTPQALLHHLRDILAEDDRNAHRQLDAADAQEEEADGTAALHESDERTGVSSRAAAGRDPSRDSCGGPPLVTKSVVFSQWTGQFGVFCPIFAHP